MNPPNNSTHPIIANEPTLKTRDQKIIKILLDAGQPQTIQQILQQLPTNTTHTALYWHLKRHPQLYQMEKTTDGTRHLHQIAPTHTAAEQQSKATEQLNKLFAQLPLQPPTPTTHRQQATEADRQPTTKTKTRGEEERKEREANEQARRNVVTYPSDILNTIVEEDIEAGELPSWIDIEPTHRKPTHDRGDVGGRREQIPSPPPLPPQDEGIGKENNNDDSDAHFFRYRLDYIALPTSDSSGFRLVGERRKRNGKYYAGFGSGITIERNQEGLIVYITRLNTEQNAYRAMRLAILEAEAVQRELMERYPGLVLSLPVPLTRGHYELADPVARRLYDEGLVGLPHTTPGVHATYDSSPRPGMIGFRDPESAERHRAYRAEMFGDAITVEKANAYADNSLSIARFMALQAGFLERMASNLESLNQGARLMGSVTQDAALRSIEGGVATVAEAMGHFMQTQADFLNELRTITRARQGRSENVGLIERLGSWIKRE